MANPDFAGLLIIPSIPMLIIVYVGCLLIFGGGIAVFLLNRNVVKREQALPMVTTEGIKSPLWGLVCESPQVYYCTFCMQSSVSIPMKVYFNRADPQTLLVMGIHRCPAQHTPQSVPALTPRKRRGLPGLHRVVFVGGN